MSKIEELFGVYTKINTNVDWLKIITEQHCPYINKKCLKNRKSQPDIAI